jgi:AAA+ ATPase superfamily predicted ATPase
MVSPFKFGNMVTDPYFVNRKAEIERLCNNFSSSNNTILISPRRWGKSSLVVQASRENKEKDIHFVFINIQSFRNEESFYQAYCQEVLKSTVSRPEEILNAGKNFFRQLIPRISFSIDPHNDLAVSFDWQEAKKVKDEMLDLPERIAKQKKIRIVICIDEFQNIIRFDESASILGELRAIWMKHHHVSYCLYGSKRHMMLDIFNKESKPFYRFGDLIMLKKIDRATWLSFIVSAFEKTNKNINMEAANLIAEIAKDHSYYVQQLAHEVWISSDKYATNDNVNLGIERVIDTNSLFYQETIENLSNTQVNLLIAIAKGMKQLTSVETTSKYKIGTLNNIRKNKLALEQKDIIDFHAKESMFVDPFFEYWFRRYFF